MLHIRDVLTHAAYTWRPNPCCTYVTSYPMLHIRDVLSHAAHKWRPIPCMYEIRCYLRAILGDAHAMKVAITQFTPVRSYVMSLRSKCLLHLSLYICSIHSVSKILGQISGASSRQQNKGKSSYQYTSANRFRHIAPTFARLQSFRFSSVRTLKTPAVLSSD
jgi:hypothetical protein